jgi:hypothetical protein
MAATGLRMTPVAVLAAANAALIAWALRAHAEFLPKGPTAAHLLMAPATSRHGHADGAAAVAELPPPVTGDALANYAGLAVVALHLMLAGVVVAVWVSRRWFRPSVVDTGRILARMTFAAMVAVASALVTIGAAGLLGSAISFTSAVSASVTVLRYSFVVALISSIALGMPYRLSGKDKQCSTGGIR